MAKKRDAEALNWKEYLKFLEFVKDKDIDAYNYFLIIGYTGVRSNEYKQIVQQFKPIEGSSVIVPTTFYIHTSKREDKRQIDLPEDLTKYKKHIELINYSERQQRYLCEKWIKKAIKARILEERLLSPHDFRATFITALINRGLDVVQVQNVTKHKNIDNLLIYYKRNKKDISMAYELLKLEEWDKDNNPVLLEKALWKERQLNIELKKELKEIKKIHLTCSEWEREV